MITVLSTTSSKKEARKIAKVLITEKLAACVQIVPNIESHYKWQGKACSDKEFLMIIKTQKKKFNALEKAITDHHSYDVPQIVALPIVRGSKAYLKWLATSLISN